MQSWTAAPIFCVSSGRAARHDVPASRAIGTVSGPLAGVKVIEFAGLGPVPFCGMLLSDLGAEVIRIDRKSGSALPFEVDYTQDVISRGRRSLGLDLKKPEAVETCLRLVEQADVVIEGYRPGVMERMGLGPDICLAHNARLVYGRMTGWGQDGPMARRAGHDINYIALSGALSLLGRKGDKPFPPLNLIGDMGGGGLFLAFGVACALFEARGSGKGQIVDAAMIDGSALLLSQMFSMMAWGMLRGERGTNVSDTGAHFYEVYETADGGFMAVGAIEPQFYDALCRHAELDPALFSNPYNPVKWPALKEELARVFKRKTRDEWEAIFAGVDACVTPVLSPQEAAKHPHLRARGVYVDEAGVLQPAPGPRFSRTPGAIQRPPANPGRYTRDVLLDWGFDASQIEVLRNAGAIA